MNAQSTTEITSFALPPLVSFDVLRWTLRFGLAVSPRDMEAVRQRRRRRRGRQFVPTHLHQDIGLPQETDMEAYGNVSRSNLMFLLAFSPRG